MKITINNKLGDGSPRRGEIWINGWGIFYHGLYGFKSPQGRSFYGPSPIMRRRMNRLLKEARERHERRNSAATL
jgi:hypothetical protein